MFKSVSPVEYEPMEVDEDSEQGSRPKEITGPYCPTAEEVRNHLVNHIPFASWCPCCVNGRAVSQGHYVKKGMGTQMSQSHTISVDYGYLKSKEGT